MQPTLLGSVAPRKLSHEPKATRSGCRSEGLSCRHSEPICERRGGCSRRGTPEAGLWGKQTWPNHLYTPTSLCVQTGTRVGGGGAGEACLGSECPTEEGGREAWLMINPTGHPGWLSGGAGSAEWLLEGKTEGFWVAGRASGSGSQSRGAGSQGGDLAFGHLALGSDSRLSGAAEICSHIHSMKTS